MAASMRTMLCSSRQISVKRLFFLHRISLIHLSQKKFSSNEPEETLLEDVSVSDEMDQDEIDQIRNVSGLTDKQRRKMAHARTMPDIEYEFQKTVQYERKLYAKFGKASEIDPRIMWPTLEELREIKSEEKEWEPTLQEMWKEIEEKNTNQQQAAKKREAQIEKNMSEMGKWIQQYYDKLAAKEEEKRKQLEKKEKLLEEAREYFGYDVDPKDAKFQEMLEEKELQRKKEAKAKKKLQAAAKLAASLRMMAESASGVNPEISASISDSSSPPPKIDSKVDNSSGKTSESSSSEENSQPNQR